MTGELSLRPALQPQRRWAETAESRHAYFGLPKDPGELILPLCTPLVLVDVVMVAVVVTIPGRPAPECPRCDHVWRVAEHIKQREDHVPAVRSGEIRQPCAVSARGRVPRVTSATERRAVKAQTGIAVSRGCR